MTGRGKAKRSPACDPRHRRRRPKVSADLPATKARGTAAGGGKAHPRPSHLSTARRMWAIQVFLSSLELV